MRKPSHLPKKTHASFALSEEDRRLFRETVGAVSPVVNHRALLETARPNPRRRVQPMDWADLIATEIPLLGTGDVISFVAHGIPKRVLAALAAREVRR